MLFEQWQAWLATQALPARRRWDAAAQPQRVEHLGLAAFFAAHPQLRVPTVLAPVTAHYYWSKGMKLLGLGRAQLQLLPERGMRLDLQALDAVLQQCERKRQPVLLAVAVLGTTECGTIDPVDGVVDARDRHASSGLGFAVHAAFAALGRSDSVTVDPHKLGYLLYGAGAFICRDHRAMALLAEQAAAAAFVTHRVLPLDHANFGRLQAQTIRSAEAFHDRALGFAAEISELVRAVVPFPPDSNLVCLALGSCDVACANAFVRGLHDKLRCDTSQPLQLKEYFGSITSLRPEALGEVEMQRVLDALGLDADSIGGDGDDRLMILRHTLINPYLIDRENGISYIDGYFDFLAQGMRALLIAEPAA